MMMFTNVTVPRPLRKPALMAVMTLMAGLTAATYTEPSVYDILKEDGIRAAMSALKNATMGDRHAYFQSAWLDYRNANGELAEKKVHRLLSSQDQDTDERGDCFYLLGELRKIPHLEFIRIGSRIPVFLPQRITFQAGIPFRTGNF